MPDEMHVWVDNRQPAGGMDPNKWIVWCVCVCACACVYTVLSYAVLAIVSGFILHRAVAHSRLGRLVGSIGGANPCLAFLPRMAPLLPARGFVNHGRQFNGSEDAVHRRRWIRAEQITYEYMNGLPTPNPRLPRKT